MVHLFKNNGYNIALDVNSGSIHSLDEVAYDIIDNYGDENLYSIVMKKHPEITKVDIDETLEDIEELKKEDKLFSEDIWGDLAPMMKKKQSVVKAICLHVAHSCNMSCEYCFAGEGEYHGEEGLMSYETGKKAIDFLVEHSVGRKNLEVDFFGGEPLLNWEVVKKLVVYARGLEKKNNKNFRFTLTTNGLGINDDVIEFTTKEMSNVVISLDGKKSTNDRMRHLKNGDGTYDLIIDKFKKLADARGQKDYYMRGTYTRNNLKFSEDLIHMADLGFKELAMEPVVTPPENDYALREEDLETLKEQYELLALEMLKRRRKGNGFNFYHFSIDLEGGPCISKRISGCGVGTEYLAITPNGEIYPCHQFVGEKEFLLGSLDEGLTNMGVLDQFRTCNVYSHEECKDCFARLYCSGGCAANAYYSTGSVNGVYDFGCELQKKRIECAMMMKVAMNEENIPENV